MENRRLSYHFIILMGLVSLFGDITYEGGRSITGPFLAILGAGAGVVGFVTGLGEFIGYGLRLLSGYYADRSRAYWPLTFIGYSLIFAIPFLAFAGHWKTAAVLIILERAGKAIRTPARDAILSHAAKEVGRGWGFGLHEFFDQIGAVIGPLIFTSVFLLKGTYEEGFLILFIPTTITMIFLFIANRKVPHPEHLEVPGKNLIKRPKGLTQFYWIYLIFTFFSVAGVLHFSLIAFHLKVAKIASDAAIPLFYVMAMATDGVTALIVGKLYDRLGLRILLVGPLAAVPLAFMALSGVFWIAAVGVAFYGIIIGVHETIMRAAIADLTRPEHRGTGYGIFNTAYGLAFFVGSSLMGLLYEYSISYIYIFAVGMQAISIIFFIVLDRIIKKQPA